MVVGTDAGVTIRAAVAERGVEVSIDLARGATHAVVGPNGAGKSTLLGLVSGALAPSSGAVTIGPDTVAEAGNTGRRFVPPHRRRCALVGQHPLLFPHMTVRENVAYGPASRGASRRRAAARATAELEAMGAAELADRRPRSLSGGQAQRVALARALAIDPDVMLLDEPFASLDASAVPDLRSRIRERLARQTTILVTHSVLDVTTLASTVVELADGRVAATGPAGKLCARPRSRFLADFVGLNLLPEEAGGRAGHGTSFLAFPPAAVSLTHTDDAAAATPGPGAGLDLAARVARVEDHGIVQRVVLDVSGHRVSADLSPHDARAHDLRPGDAVRATVPSGSVTAYS